MGSREPTSDHGGIAAGTAERAACPSPPTDAAIPNIYPLTPGFLNRCRVLK